jgi:glycosyltransferase involved in cell wall biosynthesis
LLIEARLLGLRTFTNRNSQHVSESWWKAGTVAELTRYLKERPQLFWRMVNERRGGVAEGSKVPLAFDISVLGKAHNDERARTGIHRVVDSILKELMGRHDIRLSLVAHATVIDAAKAFVGSRPSLSVVFEVQDLSSVPTGTVLHSPFFALPANSGSGPRVLTVHDLIPIKFPHLFEFGEAEALRRTIASLGADDLVTVNSEATKADLYAYAPHISPDRIAVTPLAADPEIFFPCLDPEEKNRVREKYKLGAFARYVLSVATLEPRKNIAHLIRAFAKLLREDGISDLELVLVGAKGWKFDGIFDELSLVSDIRERIVLTGFVPDEDMAPLYSNAMVFAYPSLYEGFGLPPLEAMQCGTPVIASNNSSLPEVVGDAGILVPAEDETALVAAIRLIYFNEQLRQDLSQRGIARSATFTWSRCVEQTIETYKLALARWHTRPPVVASELRPIVIDAVFFQLYQTGIARVWRSLLREWVETDFGKRLVVLDRGGTAPRFDGLRYIDVPRYDYADTDVDRAMLQRVCDAENAALFISSYYTCPLTTPSVFMAHDMIPELVGIDVANNPMWREKHVSVRHASRFLAVSQNTANDLRRFFPDIASGNVTVTHCGVDFVAPASDAVAAFRKANNIDRPYFLLVGGRDGYKNGILFFQAFAALGAARARYAIVCTGPMVTLEPEYASCVGGATVHMLNLSDADLQAAYAGALALIFPSLYEGFGMPVAEAMACGCPVVTTRRGSIPEVAGDAALYVEVGDVRGMTRALKQVQKTATRKRMVAAGLKRATLFSWRKMADEVRQVLESAIIELGGQEKASPSPVADPEQRRKSREQALGLAMKHHQAGEFEQAEAVYRQILAEVPGDFAALHMLGVVRLQRGDLKQAEQLLQRAAAMNQSMPEVHFNLGMVYAAQGRTADARTCIAHALALNKDFALARQQLEVLDRSA